ncbi:hypothetical protein O6H91_11G086700 [Diphasiastrum complanatum]|nr:hypothetical protein O6H91_11G086700 [Diphasiastrum complanatum]
MYRTAIFRATIIMVAVLLVVMICVSRWHFICSCIFPNSFQRANSNDLSAVRLVIMELRQSSLIERVSIDKVPVIEFTSQQGSSTQLGTFGTECTICLSEFEEGEMISMLPNCCHAFHLPCIDMWLVSNVSCPTCRNNLLPQSPHYEMLSGSS